MLKFTLKRLKIALLTRKTYGTRYYISKNRIISKMTKIRLGPFLFYTAQIMSTHIYCQAALFHTITELLTDNQHVIVIAINFSKAFDTARHVTLLEKLVCLDLPDCVYKWLVHYFSGYSHCTNYRGCISTMENITLFKGLLSDRCRMLSMLLILHRLHLELCFASMLTIRTSSYQPITSITEPLKSITFSLGLDSITLL